MLPRRPDLPPLPDPPEASASLGGPVAMLVGGAVGAVLAVVAIKLFEDVSGLELLAGLLVGLPLALVVHELGHVVGGQVVGWRFALFIAGPLHVERDDGRMRWSLNRSLPLTGGLAASLPTTRRGLARKMAVVVACGPLASLLLGGLGLALAGGTGVAHVLGVLSMAVAVGSLAPTRAGGFPTDGARLLRLARGGPGAAREAIILSVITQATTGVRPREWDAPGLAEAAALADGDVMEESARGLATARAFDQGDVEAAQAHLTRRVALWHTIPEGARDDLATDAALFEAVVRGDVDRARAWLAEVPSHAVLPDPAAEPFVEAFIAQAEGDVEAARAHAEAARTAAGLERGMGAVRDEWLAAAGL